MELRPNSLPAYANLASALAIAAQVKNDTMPDCCGFTPASVGTHVAPWVTAQFNGLGLAKRMAAGCTATKHGSEAPRWTTSISGSSAGRWFFAQASDPEEEQEEPEDEEEAKVEPKQRNAPAVRKPSARDDNAEQLREDGTINPPFP